MSRILFVDDDAATRDLFARVLNGSGFWTQAVPTGEVALVLLRERIRFDLLVTDIVLRGGLNGFDLADLATALQPDLAVIYLTGYVNLPRRRLRDLRGRIITKPVLPRQLEREIREVLAAAA